MISSLGQFFSDESHGQCYEDEAHHSRNSAGRNASVYHPSCFIWGFCYQGKMPLFAYLPGLREIFENGFCSGLKRKFKKKHHKTSFLIAHSE